MRVFLILALLLATAFAGRDDDNMGFDEESSGDGRDSTVFPTDDEDIETESSGEGTDANVAVDETETIDVENEPEVVNVNGRDKSVKTIDEEEPDSDLDDTDAEKPVEPDVEVDDDREVTNEEEDEGGDRDAGKYTGIETQFMAAVIVGGCIGLLFAICVIMLLVYRMRKKDEGSYSLEYDGKKPQGNYEYTKGVDSKEYYA